MGRAGAGGGVEGDGFEGWVGTGMDNNSAVDTAAAGAARNLERWESDMLL